MFVFGEVQDPNPTAVNLVEDIVRSQVLEIVCLPFTFDTTPLNYSSHLRSFKLVSSPPNVEQGISHQKTSSLSFVTIEPR